MTKEQSGASDYVIRVLPELRGADALAWNALLATQRVVTPFMRAEFLQAMADSRSACDATGWRVHYLLVWHGASLVAACPCYGKDHSWGEYVFDWSWASAYERAGLNYYPKALVASPFSPVPGSRLMALTDDARDALLQALLQWTSRMGWSSLHLLFLEPEDEQACRRAGLSVREGMQFHWANAGYADFDAFLNALTQVKRKKIRQEQRRVADAGVRFNVLEGQAISEADWLFFYACYERTYHTHGQLPHLTPDFFNRVAQGLPDHWVMVRASRSGVPIACSLLAVDQPLADTAGSTARPSVAYGRYWGALETVDCLHFDTCYYQPLRWCIDRGISRFEGGAQGEHKLARALMPVRTVSAHWLVNSSGAAAIDQFVQREGAEVHAYRAQLAAHGPFRDPPNLAAGENPMGDGRPRDPALEPGL